MVFPVAMYECETKKAEQQRINSFDKTLESSLDNKEIRPVNPKGNQSRIFIGRNGAEAEAPIFWPPVVKS